MALSFKRYEGTTAVVLSTSKWCRFKLRKSYSHPATLTWTVLAAQHSTPINHNEGIQFFDSNFSATVPIFEGHIQNISPGQGSNEVNITAYGADFRADKECIVTNGLCTLATAIPRAVYNVSVDADEDKGFEQLTYPSSSHADGYSACYATVGQIIADLLDNQLPKLQDILAAPDDGSDPYVQAELDALDMQPQEKVVFEGVGVRSAIIQLLQLYPAKRLVFDHRDRIWHIVDPIEDDDQETITLNQTASADNPVLSMQWDRNLEECYTAFKLVGRPETQYADVKVSDDTLTELPDGSGPMSGYCRQWQVTDEAKRHLFRLIRPPHWVEINIPFGAGYILTYLLFDHAALLASWDDGDTWEIVPEFSLQISRGIVTTPTYLFHSDSSSSSTLTEPDDVRLVFHYFSHSIIVRYPTTGYSGDAYDDFGIVREKLVPHELLNTGFAEWDTVTRDFKLLHYGKLAQEQHKAYCNPVYQGGFVLHKLDYTWLFLNKLVNVTSLTENGGAQTTGWESAKAILTDVEYDFSLNGIGGTTLTVNGDRIAFGGGDVEAMRLQMKIGAQAKYETHWEAGYTIGKGVVELYMGNVTTLIGMEG